MCVCVRVLSLAKLLHSCRLHTCKTDSVAWLLCSPAPSLFQRRRPIAVCVLYSPAPSLFQRRRPIAVCVLYSPALSLFQPRRPIAVCWRSLDVHALCSVLSGVGRQPRPVPGSVCSKLGVVLLQLCIFRKRCGRCSQVVDVRAESTEYMVHVHATQGTVPLAWLAQWGCCLPHFVYSVLCVDPDFFVVD